MRVLPRGSSIRWAGRMINTHPSLLPNYKACTPHEAAIGPATRGRCSVHVVTAGWTRPLLGQVPVAYPARRAQHPIHSRRGADGRISALPGMRRTTWRMSGRRSTSSPRSASAPSRCPKRTRSLARNAVLRGDHGKKSPMSVSTHHGDGKTALLQDQRVRRAGAVIDMDPALLPPPYFGDAGSASASISATPTGSDQPAGWSNRGARSREEAHHAVHGADEF